MSPLAAKLVYFLGYWLATFVIRAPYIRQHRRAPIRSNRNDGLDRLFFGLVSCGGFLLPLLYIFSGVFAFADYTIPLWVGLSGVAVLIVGDWLFWRSHKDLGTNWSPQLHIREQHTLVTRGVYGKIRHPMYAAIWLMVVAQAMILPNYFAGFSGLIPFACLYFYRVGREERMMLEQFGAGYGDYMQRTGRILPKI